MRLPISLPTGILLFLCLIIAFTDASASSSKDGEWTIVNVSGSVSVVTGEAAASEVRPGTRLQAPFTIRTEGDGQLLLERGEDSLSVGPDTHLQVPARKTGTPDLATRINQTLGSVLYQVQHRLKDVFEVHTPYLVSVVKGTTFNILVTADTSTVALIEGRLLVHSPDAQAEVLLEAGQAAIRSADDEAITIEDQREVSAPVTGPIRIGRDEAQLALATASPRIAVDLGRLAGDDVLEIGGHTLAQADVLRLDSDGALIAVDDTAVDLGGARIASTGASLDVEIHQTSLDIGGVSIADTALTPAIALGDTSASVGEISLEVGLSPGIELGDTSLNVAGASIGATGLTPSINLGETSVALGGLDVEGGLSPNLDLGDTRIELGGLEIGETALTPDLGIGKTSLEVSDAGIGLATQIDAGIIGPLALDVEIDVGLGDVEEVVNDAGSTLLEPVVEILGRLPLF